MQIIIWVIAGGLIGWFISLIAKNEMKSSAMRDTIVGIIGAVAGGWVMNYFLDVGINIFNIYSFGVALVSAIVLVIVVKELSRMSPALK